MPNDTANRIAGKITDELEDFDFIYKPEQPEVCQHIAAAIAPLVRALEEIRDLADEHVESGPDIAERGLKEAGK